MSETTSTKRKISLPLVLAGSVSSLVLALGMSPTFSAFTASIQNSTNSAATGTLVMQETGTAGTCLSTDGAKGLSENTATCATINKYGGTTALLTPGGAANVTTVTIKNVGTVPATTFSLTPGACTQTTPTTTTGSATDLCAKLHVKITTGATTVYDGSADAFKTAQTLTALAAGASASYTFTVSLDSTADNTYQGLQASQPLTWTFQA
jgi:hypothetical protein